MRISDWSSDVCSSDLHAAQVDERAEVDDRGHDALADLALLEVVEEGAARLALRLLEQRTAAQDHVVAVLVELADLGLDLRSEERRVGKVCVSPCIYRSSTYN